jgi:hypothetical protein
VLVELAAGQTFSIPATQILGYTDNKVIGTCSNCVQTEVALTSFEPAAPGGWVYNPAFTLQTLSKHSFTGFFYFNLASGNITKTITPLTGKNMVVSYWTIGSSKWVNLQTGTEGRTALIDGVVWKQYRHILNNPSTITISGSGFIDELRMYPQNAEVSTYTYADDKGIITQCDAFDRTSYNEYDAFNRVAVVRDLDYRILKTYCYGQAGELHDCNTTVHYNDPQQATLTRTDCMGGLVAGNATYIVPANTYYSYISKADANQKALADLDANKQMFANLNGACNVIYQSDDFSGVYYSSLCTWPQTPQPLFVGVPSGMFTSTISKPDANAQALAYAQNYANVNGQCNSQVNLQYNHYGWGYVSVMLTKMDTYEQYYFDIYYGGSGLFGSVPSGNYDITIYASNWQSFAWGCGYYQSGTYISFYNVPVSQWCNTLDIY